MGWLTLIIPTEQDLLDSSVIWPQNCWQDSVKILFCALCCIFWSNMFFFFQGKYQQRLHCCKIKLTRIAELHLQILIHVSNHLSNRYMEWWSTMAFFRLWLLLHFHYWIRHLHCWPAVRKYNCGFIKGELLVASLKGLIKFLAGLSKAGKSNWFIWKYILSLSWPKTAS